VAQEDGEVGSGSQQNRALNVKLKEQTKNQARIDQLQAQMESLKKVDLTIEKKKRERTNR
jgi:hypothetical protein